MQPSKMRPLKSSGGRTQLTDTSNEAKRAQPKKTNETGGRAPFGDLSKTSNSFPPPQVVDLKERRRQRDRERYAKQKEEKSRKQWEMLEQERKERNRKRRHITDEQRAELNRKHRDAYQRNKQQSSLQAISKVHGASINKENIEPAGAHQITEADQVKGDIFDLTKDTIDAGRSSDWLHRNDTYSCIDPAGTHQLPTFDQVI